MHENHATLEILWQQYRLCVEMADRISQRRDSANRFFAAFLTTGAGILLFASRMDEVPSWTIGIAGVVGLLLSFVWVWTLQTYKNLNKAKYQVILAMEKDLPWACFGEEHRFRRGPSLTKVEMLVPIGFGLLSLVGIGVWMVPVFRCLTSCLNLSAG